MIIWLNCKITDVRLTPIGNKGNIKTDNRYDVAKYCLASLGVLSPLISKILFNITLCEPYTERKSEMEEWIRKQFPAEKIGRIVWKRCDNISEWREVQKELSEIDDDILYLPGQEDHIFMAPDIDLWKQGLDHMIKDPMDTAVFAVSHYPETLRNCFMRPHRYCEEGNFVNCFPYDHEVSSSYIIKRELYNRYLDHHSKNTPNKSLFRLEDFTINPAQSLYLATRELNRHYDGYTHVHMDLNVCPPIDIPVGFFDNNIVIRYGFNDRDPACVNINPAKQNLYSVDINGTDYKWTLDDIPLFWKSHIKDIQIAPNIDHDIMKEARNNYMLKLSRAAVWGHSVPIPELWLSNHMIK